MPASYVAQDLDQMSLSDFVGDAADRLLLGNQYDMDTPPTAVEVTSLLNIMDPPDGGPWNLTPPGQRAQPPRTSFPGTLARTEAEDWFEDVYVLPRSLDVGLILSTQQFAFSVFNSDRELAHDWDAFTNNVDNGVSIINLPSLPFTMDRMHGTSMTLEVTPDGPATIDGTLDFQFDFPIDPTAIQVEVLGSRIVLWAFEPESSMIEKLEFRTDILEHADGTEQRVSMRKNPRQSFEMVVPLDDGPERQRAEYLLFNWQDKVFAFPVWHEPSVLMSDIPIGTTVIPVNTTDFADYRVGGQMIILESQTTFDAQVVVSFTSTSITIASPTTNAYAAGVRVYPMRTVIADQNVAGLRFPVNLDELEVRMRVLDNDSDLADTSAFSTFNSKVLLDDDNFVKTSSSQSLVRKLQNLDNLTGIFQHQSIWDRSRRTSTKLAIIVTRQRLWEYRQLLHALRGRQVSFYIPTFFKDLEIADTLGSGATIGTITNVGYAQHVQQRSPNNVIRVELNDGTVFTRTITGSAPIDAATEQITIDAGWPQLIEPEDVARVDMLEKVRLDSDVVTIRHLHAAGSAEITFPLRVVLE